MNTQIDVPESASDLRVLADDEIDLVNGGSFWSTFGDYIISAGSFLMGCALFGLVGWIATRSRP